MPSKSADQDASSNSTSSITYQLNASNLVISSFATLLILLLLVFLLGLMYICAKLRRQSSNDSDIGDTGWVHNSFQRQSISAAAATASMYRQGGALSWDSKFDNDEQRQLDLSHAVLEMEQRPAFFSVGAATRTTATATSSAAPTSPTMMTSDSQQARRPSMAFGSPVARGNPVPAGVPRLQAKDESEQQYDQLRLRQLALSGPFENEHAVSCDSLADAELPPPGSEYQSEEYLAVELKK